MPIHNATYKVEIVGKVVGGEWGGIDNIAVELEDRLNKMTREDFHLHSITEVETGWLVVFRKPPYRPL